MTGKLCFLAALLTVSGIARGAFSAEQYALVAEVHHADLQRVKVLFESDGKLLLNTDGKQAVEMPIQVKAQLQYDEKLLDPTAAATSCTASARYYKSAQATVTFREAVMRPALREERRLIAAAATDVTKPTVFSPLGPLTRDELDLVDVPGNSLLLDHLLPNKRVTVGQRWQLETKALAPLFALDAINQSDIECQLKSVQKELAIVYLQGTISGAVGGVASEIRLAAKYNFDFTRKRITWFALSMKEKRSIGHAHPGLDVTARLQLATSKATQCPQLDDNLLADIHLDATDASQLLEFNSGPAGFQMLSRAQLARDD